MLYIVKLESSSNLCQNFPHFGETVYGHNFSGSVIAFRVVYCGSCDSISGFDALSPTMFLLGAAVALPSVHQMYHITTFMMPLLVVH